MSLEVAKNIIEIPSFDLRNLEALDRVLENLILLDENIGGVSSCINSQIEIYKQKIMLFIERVNLCKRKLQALNSINAALPFTSPAKFPIQYQFSTSDRKSVYKNIISREKFTKIDPKQSTKMIHTQEELGKYPDIHKEDIYNMLSITQGQFIQRRRNIFEGANAITNNISHNSLGEAPRKAKCAETFLIFNTKINPYKHYSNMRNLIDQHANVNQKVKKNRNNDEITLVEAPQTLKEHERLSMYTAADDYYKPQAKEIPTLQFLPSGLGDFMQGIVSFDSNLENHQTFAPSQDGLVKSRKQIADPTNLQPDNQVLQRPQQQQPAQQQQTYQQPQQNQGPPPISSLSGPPPINALMQQQGPPPINALQQQQPPKLNLNQPLQGQPQQQPKQAPKANNTNALLEEIRNPQVKLKKRITIEKGGINLQTAVQPKQTNDVKQKKGGEAAGGGSLMDHLKEQINLRFQALHPNQQKSKKNANTKHIGSESEEKSNSDDDD